MKYTNKVENLYLAEHYDLEDELTELSKNTNLTREKLETTKFYNAMKDKTSISLSGFFIGMGIEELLLVIKFIEIMPWVKSIDLSGVNLGDNGIEVSKALKNCQYIEELSMCNSKLGDKLVAAMENIVQMRNLNYIAYKGNSWGDNWEGRLESVHVITKRNDERKVEFRDNKATPAQMESLSYGLKLLMAEGLLTQDIAGECYLIGENCYSFEGSQPIIIDNY